MKQLMMGKWCVLALALLASTAWADSQLVGQWGLNGRPYIAFNKDGTGVLDGDAFTWRAQRNNLVLSSYGETNTLAYQIKGSELVMQFGFIPLRLQRMGGDPAGAAAFRAKGESVAAAKSATEPLETLLLSSAWCSFKYNKVSGSSSSTRFQFFNNGTYSNSGRSETYNSGRYGTVAGQHDSGGRGQWQVHNGQLYVSNPPEQPDLQPVPVMVTRNSSGYPIINAEGVEYSMCK